jgi:hypothetical protein
VIVTRGLGLPAEGNLAVAGFGLVTLVPPPPPLQGGGSSGGHVMRAMPMPPSDDIENDWALIVALLEL